VGGVRRPGVGDANSGGGKRIGVTTTLAEEMMIDTEAAVMANFEFLASEVRPGVDFVKKTFNFFKHGMYVQN
jgi:hypothetical protein